MLHGEHKEPLSSEEQAMDSSRVFRSHRLTSTTRSIFLQQHFDHATALLTDRPWHAGPGPFPHLLQESPHLCLCPIRREVIVFGLKVPGAVTRAGCETSFCRFLERWPWVICAVSSGLAALSVSCPYCPAPGFVSKSKCGNMGKRSFWTLTCFLSTRYMWMNTWYTRF